LELHRILFLVEQGARPDRHLRDKLVTQSSRDNLRCLIVDDVMGHVPLQVFDVKIALNPLAPHQVRSILKLWEIFRGSGAANGLPVCLDRVARARDVESGNEAVVLVDNEGVVSAGGL
jgi:hypothetical protein